MEEMFWAELRSLSDEDLKKAIEMAKNQLEINAQKATMKSLHKIFEALQELAENDGKYIVIYEDKDENTYFTVNDLAKYFIDKFDF